jgi:hypothetical protein
VVIILPSSYARAVASQRWTARAVARRGKARPGRTGAGAQVSTTGDVSASRGPWGCVLSDAMHADTDRLDHGRNERARRREVVRRGARNEIESRAEERGGAASGRSGDGSRERRDRDVDRPEAGERATERREEKTGDAGGRRGQGEARRRQKVMLRRAAGEDGAMSIRVLSCRIRAASAEWAEQRRRGFQRAQRGSSSRKQSRYAILRRCIRSRRVQGLGGRICQERGRGRW